MIKLEFSGVFWIVLVLFIAAKLFGFIDISWWWIIGIGIGYAILVILGLISIIIFFRRLV